MNHHTHDKLCPLCAEKETTLNPELATWWRWVKDRHPEAHIAWGFRDEENQNQFYAEGKTRARWPHSKHNVMKDGKPCAEAFDCFIILADNLARFPASWYKALAQALKEASAPIQWAGEWTGFKEQDHFQLQLPPAA